ncbi:hypothetical protein JH094_002007 [Acinetobacter baumannii]|uniref:hypothetical protein n=1 Tax=Acinetobacter calcoaceticus/baumannii complex TaxID=909768 RepID=UPI0002BB1CB8|nr:MULTISPECIES: hypothetical protein [Acinetobacter calcoaceticus/baumannii complex]EKX0731958.1 hypothetical protein [Acinetobacter baumannii]EKX0879635.1 hypothetical protein [Acinetobacter baumannii]EKX9066721.1 hypothetical protein [Acinetobacter baumannii]MBQ4946732.1 hypothetical protein [Acinetobacter baumannii]MBR7715573.1 hypothetical protein [Acinetobacter nosocomialis]
MSIYQKVMESKQLASEVHEFLASGGQIKTYQGCEFTHKPEHTTRFLAKKASRIEKFRIFRWVLQEEEIGTRRKQLAEETGISIKRIRSIVGENSPSHMTREEYRLLIAAIKRIENGAKS